MSRPIEILVPVGLVSLMLSVGLETRRADVVAVLQQPRRLLRALIMALVLLPAVTYAVGRTLPFAPPIAAALMLLALAPGAPLAPGVAGKGKGSVPFATVLDFFLVALTVFTAPALAGWLRGGADSAVRAGPVVARLLLLQLAPLLVGGAVAARWPAPALRLDRVCKLVFAAAILLILVVGRRELVEGVGSLGLAGLGATLLGAALAWGSGWLGGDDGPTRRAAVLTYGAPNVGLALTLLTAAGAPQTTVLITLGMWLVRVLLNASLAVTLGRRGAPEARLPREPRAEGPPPPAPTRGPPRPRQPPAAPPP